VRSHPTILQKEQIRFEGEAILKHPRELSGQAMIDDET
jgi:hypothetical protein